MHNYSTALIVNFSYSPSQSHTNTHIHIQIQIRPGTYRPFHHFRLATHWGCPAALLHSTVCTQWMKIFSSCCQMITFNVSQSAWRIDSIHQLDVLIISLLFLFSAILCSFLLLLVLKHLYMALVLWCVCS